jgi:phosphate transport system substrate-binding protein
MRTIVAALAMAITVSIAGGCARPRSSRDAPDGAGAERTISQIGSTTLLPLAREWREAFNAEHPEAEIAVSGGGSGTGIKALIGRTADIANSSREIEAKEVEQAMSAGVDPVEHLVALDGIAIIVHPSNPLSELFVEQVSDIYTGAIPNWADLGPAALGEIQVVSRDSASGTYEAFKELVVMLDGSDRSRDYTPAALRQGSNQAILALVAQTKGAIGYVGIGYLDDSVKALDLVPIGGIEPVGPTVANVLSGDYPASRALYCYTDGEPTGALKQYVDWVKGPGGQAIVRDLGFVPVSE